MSALNLLADACTACLQGATNPNSCNSVCQQYTQYGGTGKIKNPLLPFSLQQKSAVEYLNSFLPSLIGLFFVVGSIGFFFMVLLGGIQWIFSGGDKGAVENAKGRISNAIIGLVVMFAVFAIAGLIEAFFSVNVLTIDIGPLKIQ